MRRTHLIAARVLVLLASLLAFAVPHPGTSTTTPLEALQLVEPTTKLVAPPQPTIQPTIQPTKAIPVRHAECAAAMQRAVEIGWPLELVPELERTAWRESRCQTSAENRNRNGTTDRGLLQINDVNVELVRQAGVLAHSSELFDLDTNLRAALVVHSTAGSFCPWQAPTYCS
jgi:hypothetical protein